MLIHLVVFYLSLQYIQPHEHEKLSQVELLVVDEAAAIPLPVVKALLGPYLVFLSSTVNGYNHHTQLYILNGQAIAFVRQCLFFQ